MTAWFDGLADWLSANHDLGWCVVWSACFAIPITLIDYYVVTWQQRKRHADDAADSYEQNL